MSTSSKPTRAKSRLGCLRCKSKKIKCDEAKPACQRCIDRNLECPGYARNLRWSDKHEFQRQSNKNSDFGQSGSATTFAVAHPTPIVDSGSRNLVSSQNVPQSGADSTELQRYNSSPMPQLEDFLNLFDTTYRQNHTSTHHDHGGYIQDFLLSDGHDAGDDGQLQNNFSMNPTLEAMLDINNRMVTQQNLGGGLHRGAATMRRQLSGPTSNHTPSGWGFPVQEAPETSLRLSNELTNTPSALCGYFFKEVITLYCAWDGKSNHMRTMLENLWQTSAPLFHTIQSMAAACLADDFPQLSTMAAREHANALACLRDDTASSTVTDDKLLALILLGQTASWHSPNDLATERFRTVQSALDKWYQGDRQDATSSFFSDTMNYWSMLLAFLTDQDNLNERNNDSFVGPSASSSSLPHPLCGTARDVVKMLADVGTLIFQFRKRQSTMRFMTEEDVQYFRTALGEARRLEKVLMEYIPTSNVLDPGDPRTPLMHFHHINEAYRCTGLLQLYRVFPDMLNQRYRPWSKEELLRPPPASQVPTEEQRNLWLTKLAMHILGHLREIPFESRTRSVQPFIFVAVSSELRLSPNGAVADFEGNEGHFFIEVARARKFVSSRLSAYMHILPLRKVKVIFELVTSMWAELDAGKSNIYWVDYAFQKSLGTIMG